MEGNKVVAKGLKVPVDSLKIDGPNMLRKHMLERLKSDKFPFVELVIGEGENQKGKGKIKIKGIEKPISGTYKIKDKKVLAEFMISLKEFNFEKINYLVVSVKDDVLVKVELPIK